LEVAEAVLEVVVDLEVLDLVVVVSLAVELEEVGSIRLLKSH
jgi:hypothetical protein